MEAEQVLLGPWVTEKASALTEKYNQVTFRVAKNANKHHIRAAVEAMFKVTVMRVNTLISHGKVKRRGQSTGRRPNQKKAVVTLKQGDAIDFFQAE